MDENQKIAQEQTTKFQAVLTDIENLLHSISHKEIPTKNQKDLESWRGKLLSSYKNIADISFLISPSHISHKSNDDKDIQVSFKNRKINIIEIYEAISILMDRLNSVYIYPITIALNGIYEKKSTKRYNWSHFWSILISFIFGFLASWAVTYFTNNNEDIKKIIEKQGTIENLIKGRTDSLSSKEYKKQILDSIESKNNSMLLLIEKQNERINHCNQIIEEHTSILNRNATILDSLLSKQ